MLSRYLIKTRTLLYRGGNNKYSHNHGSNHRNFSGKIYPSCEEAIKASGLKSGDTILAGGFGICGSPIGLAHTIAADTTLRDLTIVSNNCGLDKWGLGLLLNRKQIKRMVSSYVGENKEFAKQYLSGELEVDFVPQGTLAERLRAGGAGVPGFYTPTGVGTWVQAGKVPVKYNSKGEVEIYSKPKEAREFNGRTYLLEEAISGNIGLIKCHQADTFGNCKFRGTTRNLNPECARAAKFTIVECDEIVPLGYFKPEEVHLPGVYVDAIVQTDAEKRYESLKLSNPNIAEDEEEDFSKLNERQKSRFRIAKRAARELKNDMVVNLGIGIPTLIPNYLPKGVKVWLQAEDGLLGVGRYPYPGEEDPDWINAGKEDCTAVKGASIFSSSQCFAMIRGGHLHRTFLGAMEVAANGDIANWMVPGQYVKGMGGAMDLVTCGSEVIVAMEHTDKNDHPKVVERCSLPLTGMHCVKRIVTDLCVFDVTPDGLKLVELLDNASLEEVKMKTGCKFEVPSDLKSTKVLS